MPERGQAGAPRGGGVRKGIQPYGNVRGKRRTPLEKLEDQRIREKKGSQTLTPGRGGGEKAHDRPSLPSRTPPRASTGPRSLPTDRTPSGRYNTESKSKSARKAAGSAAGKKKAQETTTGRAEIPPERTVSNPFPQKPPRRSPRRGAGRTYNPQRTARTNLGRTGKGLAKVAGAAAATVAGGAILGGTTDRTGSKDKGLQKITGGRYRGQRPHDAGGQAGHDRPQRPLPSTASTGPASYTQGGRYSQAGRNIAAAAKATGKSPIGHQNRGVPTQGVPKASTGIYSVERVSRKGGVTPEQVKFAKGQLSKAGYAGRGTGRQVVESFKALNQGAAKRRTQAGMQRATSTGHYSALSAGDPGKTETQANKTARRSRVPRLMGR